MSAVANEIHAAASDESVGTATNLNDALLAAADYMEEKSGETGRKAVLVLTDNLGLNYRSPDQPVIDAMHSASTVLNAIVVGKGRARTLSLQIATKNPDFTTPDVFTLAEQTGGEAVKVDTAGAAFERMIERIRTRYSIHYNMPNSDKAGYRKISVELTPDREAPLPACGDQGPQGLSSGWTGAQEQPLKAVKLPRGTFRSDMKPAVVLLSGGFDSATVLAIAKQQGFTPYTLSFDYNQRHRWELEQAQRIADHARVARHQVISFDLRAFGGSALTSDVDVPEGPERLRYGHSDHICAGAEYYLPLLCSRVCRDAQVFRHLHRGECARLQRIPGLPARVHCGVRADGEPCHQGRCRRPGPAYDSRSVDRDDKGADYSYRSGAWSGLRADEQLLRSRRVGSGLAGPAIRVNCD